MESHPAMQRNKEFEGHIVGKKVHKYRPGNAIRKTAHNKIKNIWSKTGQYLKI
jgi:hypothetical protein